MSLRDLSGAYAAQATAAWWILAAIADCEGGRPPDWTMQLKQGRAWLLELGIDNHYDG